MRVKCIHNTTNSLNKKLHDYSYNQDDNGNIDISVGSIYDVYGIQSNPLGTFYLVLTDEINVDIPWWMPAGLYQVYDPAVPTEWVKKEKGTLAVSSYPIYFEAEEDIEDGTERGYEVFKEMQYLNQAR